jgi:hypothetical protein
MISIHQCARAVAAHHTTVAVHDSTPETMSDAPVTAATLPDGAKERANEDIDILYRLIAGTVAVFRAQGQLFDQRLVSMAVSNAETMLSQLQAAANGTGFKIEKPQPPRK